MIIEETTILSFDSGLATLSVGASVAALARSAAAELAQLFSRAAGCPVRIELASAPTQTSATAQPSEGGNGAATSTAFASDEIRQHPLVRQAEELFGARVVRVEPGRPTS